MLCAFGAGLVSAGLASGRALAESSPSQLFVVIVHARNPMHSASREFLEGAFLKKVTRWGDGELIRPVDLGPSARARRGFSQSVLRRSVETVKTYWLQRIFSGRDTPPPELESDEAVVRYVSTHRGAIGYVSPDTNLTGTKSVSIR